MAQVLGPFFISHSTSTHNVYVNVNCDATVLQSRSYVLFAGRLLRHDDFSMLIIIDGFGDEMFPTSTFS